jgi:DNA polymerase II small subunit
MPEEISSLISKIVKAGYQISPDAYQYLTDLSGDEAERVVSETITEVDNNSEEFLVIDKALFESLERKRKPSRSVTRSLYAFASDIAADVALLDREEGESAADSEGFLEYFRNRFEQLNDIIRKRMDARDSLTIDKVRKLSLNTDVKVIGIITGKRARGHRLFFELEDMEDSITIMASDEEVVREGLQIQEDQVICVEAFKYREDLLIANKFILPDIPSKESNRAEDPVCAALLADVHVGSNFFREDLFKKFIDWLNMKSSHPNHKELSSRVKYILIAGDIIDGIGIYPDQLEELTLPTLQQQYETASKLLQEIPEYMEVIIIPGNHDGVRRSLPQPAIPKKYAAPFYENERIHLFENPARIKLHGVEVLICHGKALDDILSTTPGHDFHKPVKAMELLLRARHLAPNYGLTTPIAPEKRDRLVIKGIPDLLHMGHIHIQDTGKYKSTTMVASGTFQDQTPFQKRMNIEPTPGIVNIFDLKSHQLSRLDLNNL